MTLRLYVPEDNYVPHKMARIRTKDATLTYWSDGTWKSEEDPFLAQVAQTYHNGSDIPGWTPDRIKVEMERMLNLFPPDSEAKYEILVQPIGDDDTIVH